jgi:protein-tyrosine phosphatase
MKLANSTRKPQSAWKARLRSIAKRLRFLPDRLLHPLRRRRQFRHIRGVRLPRSVLFVCHGNICRSPYAEHVFIRGLPPVLQESMAITSGGFVGPNRPAPREALLVAAERGIDLRTHRSQLLNGDLVRNADLVVVMERSQRERLRTSFGIQRSRVLVLGDLDPLPVQTRTVLDPFQKPREAFAETYGRIDRCIEQLIVAITGEPPETRHGARGEPAAVHAAPAA